MAPLYNRYIPPKTTSAKAGAAKSSPTYSTSARNGTQNPSPPGTVLNGAAPGLYARYIPGKPRQKPSSAQDSHPAAPVDPIPDERHAEQVNGSRAGDEERRKRRKKSERDSPSKRQKVDGATEHAASVQETISPEQSQRTSSSRTLDGKKDRKRSKKSKEPTVSEKSSRSASAESREDDDERSRSHTAILSKYRNLTTTKPEDVADDGTIIEPEQPPEVNRLEPIPLPPEAANEQRKSWTALPSWFAEPKSIAPNTTVSFQDTALSPHAAKVLRAKNFDNALAVQAGVLPLLLPTPAQHPGDVCVSAATGSGKTLSYVLPIVEQLQKTKRKALRAVIIVPTRELVSQVEETCNLFQASHDIRIGSAIGNRAFKDEQTLLVERYLQYDTYGAEERLKRLDRSYGLEPLEGDDLDDEELLLGMGSLRDVLPNHTEAFRSRVDLLIATPGRLVDHIRNTPGFTLSGLEWLVIDEADRLLDQSFQEWADVVNAALKKYSADSISRLPSKEEESDSEDFMEPPARPPARKVMLSATMTSDLQKLSLLELRNPKLVLVSGGDVTMEDAAAGQGEQAPASGVLTLPSQLEEWAIPVGDGAEKPLYLVTLLQQILGDGLQTTTSKRKALNRSTVDDAREADESDSDSDDSSSISSSSVSSLSSSATSDSSSASSTPSSTSEPATASQPTTTPNQPQPSHPSSPERAILIFTSTNESAARLEVLLSHLLPTLAPTLANLTRNASSKHKQRLLARLRAGTLRVLIATDRASRGIDIPALTDVVSYDVPRSVTDYVHRVGRTARVGRRGSAWTLTERSSAAWFWHVVARDAETDSPRRRRGRPAALDDVVRIRRVGGQKVRKLRLSNVGEDGMRAAYETALGKLKEDVLGK